VDKERAFDAMARFEERPLAKEMLRDTIPTAAISQKDGDALPVMIEKPVQKGGAQPLDWTPMSPKLGM
jgi:hypothetical protein